MAKTMTPSIMSDSQLDKAVADFRASLRKYRGDFSRDSVQWVLGLKNPTFDAAQAFYGRVKAIDDLIVRRVKVNHDRTPQQMLDTIKREQYARWNYDHNEGFPDGALIANMPKGKAGEVELYFFLAGGCQKYLSNAQLEMEYGWRGLRPAAPYTLLAFDAAEPNFLKQVGKERGRDWSYSFGTHWKDAKGRCSLHIDSIGSLRLGRPFWDGKEQVDHPSEWGLCLAAGVRG